MLEKVKGAVINAVTKSKDEILAKLGEYTQNIKGWVTKEVKSDGQKTRNDMADGFGAVNTKIANLDAETKNQFNELATKLNLTKEQIESLLSLKIEDLKAFIAESNKTIQTELAKQLNELNQKLDKVLDAQKQIPRKMVFAMQNHFRPPVSFGNNVN
ncbi:hypothetical protein Noda2021_12220 [Candidatus Dependentiae bacterium Noda2021]|nr:hypothetical protein Noda2021_12220 [Candidatus Dependentiae bacterium Noda2021]